FNAWRDGALLPIGHVDDSIWDDDFDDDRDELADDEHLALSLTTDEWSARARAAYATLVAKKSKSIRWLRSELFTDEMADALLHDIDVLQNLLAKFGAWDHLEDSKLDALEELLDQHDGKKVLIFTEYR